MERMVSYAGEDAEYGALYRGCALFDVSDRGLLAVSGAARERFLQSLLTNDVRSLAPGGSARACLLNRQSKVLSLMTLFANEGRFLLDVEPGQSPALLSRLLKYRLSEPVDIEDLTGSRVRFSLRGPAARPVTSAVAGPSVNHETPRLTRASWGEVPLLVLAGSGPSEAQAEIHAPVEAGEAIWEALVRAGGTPSGWNALETSRMEAGEPRYGADVTEEILFSEAGLPEAVSHTKGCYIGQEIVTRVRTRGKVNRMRAGLRVESEIRPGDEVLMAQSPVARITSCALSPRLGAWVAFAYLKPEIAASFGLPLEVRSFAGETLRATVAPLACRS
jgi:folate-binding protein YgfZ